MKKIESMAPQTGLWTLAVVGAGVIIKRYLSVFTSGKIPFFGNFRSYMQRYALSTLVAEII